MNGTRILTGGLCLVAGICRYISRLFVNEGIYYVKLVALRHSWEMSCNLWSTGWKMTSITSDFGQLLWRPIEQTYIFPKSDQAGGIEVVPNVEWSVFGK